jgi:hypothetical protein
MQRTRWIGDSPAVWGARGAAASLALGLMVGCTSREQPATAPPGGPAARAPANDAAPAVGMKVVTLNVKGMH